MRLMQSVPDWRDTVRSAIAGGELHFHYTGGLIRLVVSDKPTKWCTEEGGECCYKLRIQSTEPEEAR